MDAYTPRDQAGGSALGSGYERRARPVSLAYGYGAEFDAWQGGSRGAPKIDHDLVDRISAALKEQHLPARDIPVADLRAAVSSYIEASFNAARERFVGTRLTGAGESREDRQLLYADVLRPRIRPVESINEQILRNQTPEDRVLRILYLQIEGFLPRRVQDASH